MHYKDLLRDMVEKVAELKKELTSKEFIILDLEEKKAIQDVTGAYIVYREVPSPF